LLPTPKPELHTVHASGLRYASTFAAFKEWRNLLNNHGAGVLPRFKVYTGIREEGKVSFAGIPQGDFVGLHARVLVGVRLETETFTFGLTNTVRRSWRGMGARVAPLVDQRGQEKKLYFLLQNWLKTKQFTEMDAEYFCNFSPLVTFVKTPQTSIPSNFCVTPGRFFESADLGETMLRGDY